MLEIDVNAYNSVLNDSEYENLLNSGYYKSDILEGKVFKSKFLYYDKNNVFVDIGFKTEGLISLSEFSTNELNDLVFGFEIDVIVENKENENNQIILSKEKANRIKVWNKIIEAYEDNENIKGTIISRVKGGFHVDIGVKAFLPGSQFDLKSIKDIDKYIGKEFDFKVIKFNKKKGNIVLSRRVLLEKERKEQRTKTLCKIKENILLEGTVKNITDYGVFVDLGGIDGLLHVTDISWGRINSPCNFFKVGDKIKVKVLKFDPESERVSLGLKQLKDNPWKNINSMFNVNNRVKGKIVALPEYGCFCELTSGIEGLIHISELFWNKKSKQPVKFLNINTILDITIYSIDTDNRRISLGIKKNNLNIAKLIEIKFLQGFIYNFNLKCSDFYFSIFKIGYNIFGRNFNFLLNNNLCHSKVLKFSNKNICELFNFCFIESEFDFFKPFLNNKQYFNNILFSYFSTNVFIFGKVIKVHFNFIFVYLGLFFTGICFFDKNFIDFNFKIGENYRFKILKINYENSEILLSF